MDKWSVRSRYSLSFALCLLAQSCAANGTAAALTQDDLGDPARIVAWLQEHGGSADRKRAEKFYKTGEAAAADGRWGIAIKAFGDSAMLLPAPDALAKYADARLREFGALRARNGTFETMEQRDLAKVERIYRAALAADGELRVLGATAKLQLERDARCVADYLESKRPDPECRPLGLYRQTK